MQTKKDKDSQMKDTNEPSFNEKFTELENISLSQYQQY